MATTGGRQDSGPAGVGDRQPPPGSNQGQSHQLQWRGYREGMGPGGGAAACRKQNQGKWEVWPCTAQPAGHQLSLPGQFRRGGSSVCLLGGAGTAPAWSTGQGRWSTSAPWCLRCACLARCLERRRTELPSCSCACRLSSWWPLCAGWSLRMTLGGGSGGWTPGEGGHAEPQRVG